MPKNSVIGNVKRLMSGNIMVFSITGLLGNFARAMVFPYASLYVLALGGDARTIGWVNFIFIRPLADRLGELWIVGGKLCVLVNHLGEIVD